MCGIFAYAGTIPDPELVTAIAQAAATRGPHAHGWTTGTATHRALGPLDPAKAATMTSPRLLGHTRLATFGRYDDPTGIQPVTADGHHVALNGNIYNPTVVHPGTWPTDTHHLAHAYADARAADRDPRAALEHVFRTVESEAWAVVVLDATGTLVAYRCRLPLWHYRTPDGVYLASRRFHPQAQPVPENTLTREDPS